MCARIGDNRAYLGGEPNVVVYYKEHVGALFKERKQVESDVAARWGILLFCAQLYYFCARVRHLFALGKHIFARDIAGVGDSVKDAFGNAAREGAHILLFGFGIFRGGRVDPVERGNAAGQEHVVGVVVEVCRREKFCGGLVDEPLEPRHAHVYSAELLDAEVFAKGARERRLYFGRGVR